VRRRPPPHAYFVVSATFHYLGPAFAVLLFARVDVLGVAWLRVASAAVVFSLWRRPWRRIGPADRRLVLGWGAAIAAMNACFYEAIDRLPLGTVAAIEFLPVILLAALGARTPRNAAALACAVPGVYLLCHVRFSGSALGLAFAFANAAGFALYIVLADRVAKRPSLPGIDGLGGAMLVATVVALPIGGVRTGSAFAHPLLLLAGIGVGLTSSVIPYVADQLALARIPRATYALLVSLMPATATAIGIVVLGQLPSVTEVAGIALIATGVALHQSPSAAASSAGSVTGRRQAKFSQT
jgi:inner membrane transporter RhtA